MGIHKEVRKLFGSSVANYIISARTAQGFEDSKSATREERQDIIYRWRQHKAEYQNVRQNLLDQGGPDGQESGRLTPTGLLQTRHLSFHERKKLHEERKATREAERTKVQSENGRTNCPFCRRSNPHTHNPRPVQQSPSVLPVPDDDANFEFEHAIHVSVAATSRGNLEEDAMIERAIRASIRELQNAAGSSLSDPEALNRAIQASIAEAGRRRSYEDSGEPITMTDEEAEHQALLEKAIQQSLLQYQLPPPAHSSAGEDIDTDEDENMKIAIQKSKEQMSQAPPEDDEELELALQKSKEELTRAKTEEEIVMEYVKKQSLAEEAHRQAMLGKQKEAPPSDADEEALKQAIQESMKSAGGSDSRS
jgi:hypothetical protein